MFLPNPITEALKTYRECREKEPTLQKELNEVNNESERKRKEIELLREELRDKCKEIELTAPMRIKWTPRMRLTQEQMNTLPHTLTLYQVPNQKGPLTPGLCPEDFCSTCSGGVQISGSETTFTEEHI